MPAVVGAPESLPAASRVRPSGSRPPPSEKVGAGDPEAVNENAYGTPTVAPAGGGPEVIATVVWSRV